MNSLKGSHNSAFLPYEDSAVTKTRDTKLTTNSLSLEQDVNVKEN